MTRDVTLSEVVAANVRAECARRGWHQGIVAEHMGMVRNAVSDRARGRTPWTLDEVERLAVLFGLEVADLLARPKGFGPLTFWLGADHTVTVWGWKPGAVDVITTYFCDECGMTGPGRMPAWDRSDGAANHGRLWHLLVDVERAS